MISIILPIFNNEKTIQRTLNSIIKNLTINDELIIINDGSTDSSLSIIKNFIKENKNLETKIISNKKQMGLAFSLNEAISLAEKKYIARIDGDDININNRFEFQLKVMEDKVYLDLGRLHLKKGNKAEAKKNFEMVNKVKAQNIFKSLAQYYLQNL